MPYTYQCSECKATYLPFDNLAEGTNHKDTAPNGNCDGTWIPLLYPERQTTSMDEQDALAMVDEIRAKGGAAHAEIHDEGINPYTKTRTRFAYVFYREHI